ncbi:threonine synthase [Leuconostocaceae bacterium ESL0723]|nr:threonine synthase [Leuconostocaceae bacterium ESL0723]
MEYVSTRGGAPAVPASQAVLNGIAPDGGLYVPTEWPKMTWDWSQVGQQSYQALAKRVFAAFFEDYTHAEIQAVVDQAYGDQWQTPDIVGLHQDENLTYMELFHGPTLAFKDVALQALPFLMTTAAAKQAVNDKIVILTATSGDTGTAAMSGFGNVNQTEIIVFYPQVGVSDIQRQQMQTERADNAHVTAITGNFDDAQRAVKDLLGNPELRQELKDHHMRFSSANSINIGRLIPQMVYYLYAYSRLVKNQKIEAGQAVDVVVPTGNFGDILAAYYAKQVGLPVKTFVVASNENNVLTDFFNTGTYDRNRDFKVTSAPAMDILVSSNLERLLYFASGRNSEEIKGYMDDLQKTGTYELTASTRANLAEFKAGFADEDQIAAAIAQTYQDRHYLLDPHTAVARHVYQQMDLAIQSTLLAATASPYKFPQAVLRALGQEPVGGAAGVQQLADFTKTAIPEQIQHLYQLPIRHKKIIKPNQILTTIREELF